MTTTSTTGEALVLDISADTYHRSERLSNSRLNKFIDDPALFEGLFITGEFHEEADNDNYDFGDIVHDVILEGGTRCVVLEIPPDVLASNGAKSGNAWKQFKAENAGKYLLKRNVIDKVNRAVDAVWQHPKARQLLEFQGANEQSLFWTDEETGLELRARLDRLTPAFIADLKTTHSTNPRKFTTAMVDDGYFRQAAFYRAGAEACGFGKLAVVFIAVKKEPPFSVETYVPDADFIDAGEREVRLGLRDFADCKASGVWRRKGWGNLVTINAPKWLLNR